VVVLAAVADGDLSDKLRAAAAAAGLMVLRLIRNSKLPAGASPALTVAILAEDLAPRPD
jgi:hypothetical protein